MPNQNRLIDLRKVCEITCQGKTSIYQLITAGELRQLANRQGVCMEKTRRAAAEVTVRDPERMLRNKPHQPVCARKGQSHE